MGWDRKTRGAKAGYYYQSVRTATGVRKVYLGRSAAAHEAALAVERRKQARLAAAATVRADQAATAEADRLAGELAVWADLLGGLWLALTGHRFRRGEWRRHRGKAD